MILLLPSSKASRLTKFPIRLGIARCDGASTRVSTAEEVKVVNTWLVVHSPACCR